MGSETSKIQYAASTRQMHFVTRNYLHLESHRLIGSLPEPVALPALVSCLLLAPMLAYSGPVFGTIRDSPHRPSKRTTQGYLIIIYRSVPLFRGNSPSTATPPPSLNTSHHRQDALSFHSFRFPFLYRIGFGQR